MKKIITVCYGKKEEWESRKQAMDSFMEAICGSDGSEQQRYVNIYVKLKCGMNYCTDDY